MDDFKQQLIQEYDKDAQRRDNAEGKRNQWKLDLRQKFVDLLKAANKKSILELGSGAGLDAKFFQDNGFDVLATDLSPEMVKMCQKRGLNAKVVDLYDLQSLDNQFDGIFSLNVLFVIHLIVDRIHVYSRKATKDDVIAGRKTEDQLIPNSIRFDLRYHKICF